jgi:hypothetical protein
MAAINRASIAKQLVPGLNAIFGMEYGEVVDELTPLFEMENSDRAFEEEVLFTGFGSAPVKNEGAAVQYDTAQDSYTARYTAETIALAFSVTEEAMEDNLYDTFSKLRARGLARAMANTKQVKGADVFNQGFNVLYGGGDGVPLFSAAHPTIGGGNQSNLIATNGTTDLSEASLESGLVSVQTAKDDRNILIGTNALSIHIAPHNQFAAARLLDSPYRPGTADNDINAINHGGLVPNGYFVNKRFSDADAWFLKTDCPNATKMFNRTPLQTQMLPDFDTGNLRYKARERYSFGWSDWRGYFGSQGS